MLNTYKVLMLKGIKEGDDVTAEGEIVGKVINVAPSVYPDKNYVEFQLNGTVSKERVSEVQAAVAANVSMGVVCQPIME